MNFKEAESYLLSLGNEVSTMKLGLENIRRLLAALGNPHDKYLKVQVAGTNGKGSVCAFIEAICREAGIRTGVTTSPHLVSMTERVRIDGRDITEIEFARLATHVRDVSEELVREGKLETVPTYFEQVTAIALVSFAEAKVELAILETGLGGRLDATTAANAEIAAITRIDLDHQQYLGDTVEQIAAEKAAIVSASTKALIIGEQGYNEVFRVIRDRVHTFGLWDHLDAKDILKDPLSRRRVPRFASNVATTIEDDRVSFDAFGEVRLGLKGSHQIENAKIAILLFEAIIELSPELLGRTLAIDTGMVVRGLEKARHPGRLEAIGNFLFDGAHNVGGARALRVFLDESVPEPITMIFGTMTDKDVADVARILFPKAKALILTRPENSRAMSADKLARFLPSDFPDEAVFRTGSVSEALDMATQVTPEGGRILVTGSLYLVGEAKKILNN